MKSHFYQLSKKHHPDVSKDPKSREIFAEVSEAYSVLSDDRQRRAYDKKLQQHHSTLGHMHPSAAYDGEWGASRRRPGATYAWHNRSRTSSRPHHPHTGHTHAHPTSSSGSTSSSSTRAHPHPNPHMHYDASAFHYVQDKSAFRRRTEAFHRERESVASVSGTIRALQLMFAIMFLVMLFAPPGSSGSGSGYTDAKIRTTHARTVPETATVKQDESNAVPQDDVNVDAETDDHDNRPSSAQYPR
ncbi:hypothetical protein D9758_011975 [Tetrapyrgos nigripes]|uniref:J domain-containing protein n=1 Tax=Tetrapyrgos nigripes TaxID=182062 RepID=A0A8H5D387_9AGAR|nr:hypothetical protein D9758_011975 [Tetrapyrgos nigripes]